jgi:Fur family transcriptional regulator, peroxide stress response regulator
MKSHLAQSLAKLESLCRERGLALTEQRRAVLHAVLERSDHPTPDQVFEAVRERSPRISRRTVYRVLDTLAELGLIRRVPHPGAATRFDGKVYRHHHLVCMRCNRIVDLENRTLDAISLPKGKPQGFEICDFSVQFIGICPDCRRKR